MSVLDKAKAQTLVANSRLACLSLHGLLLIHSPKGKVIPAKSKIERRIIMTCDRCHSVMQEGKGTVQGWLDNGQAYIFSEVKLYSCPNEDDSLTIELVQGE